MSPSPPQLLDLGFTTWPDADRVMRNCAEDLARDGSAPGTVLLAEFAPVYTAGRRTSPEDLAAAEARGLPVHAIDRGGRITFHGPGQLVVYPVLRLPERDVRKWLRRLEDFGVAVCAAFDLQARASVDGTGVFVTQRKVASIGVAIHRWVSHHGIAINTAMDLSPFFAIAPCGLDPEIVSDLSRAAERSIALDEVRGAVHDAVDLLWHPSESSK